MIDLINFTRGGMNQDDSPDSKERQRNDYDEAFLFRTDGTATGEAGNGTNFESTVKLSAPRPAGLNKAIGGAAFKHHRRAYSFIYNAQGYHQITELNHDTETETVIYTNLTDSGGVDALRLSPDRYITEMQLIDGKFLPFINSFRQPCMINIERLKARGYGVLKPDDFLLQKTQPMREVRAVYGDDASRSVNLLRRGLFQFISQYEFLDYELSAWSMISKRSIPVYEGTPAIGTDVTKLNHLVVYVNIGDDRVRVINVGARMGNFDWFTIKSIDRKKVLAITDTTINVATGILEAYDPATNTYGFAFYNDGNYNQIPPLETDLLNDAVPEEAGTMEVINSNLIALSDLKEGKPRPTASMDFVVSSYDAGLQSNTVQNATALKVRWTTEKKTPGLFNSGRHYQQVYLYFSGKPKTGDKSITTIIDRNDPKSIQHLYDFTVLAAEQDDLLKMVQRFAKEIPNSSVRNEGSEVRITFSLHNIIEHNFVREEIRDSIIQLANIGDGSSTSKPALKSNSSYQGALAYYDKFGNPFPIATDENFVFTTPSYAQLKGRGVRADWTITSQPPVGAAYYNILLSDNNSHDKTLFVLAKESGKSLADYVILYINPLKKFNENNNASVLSYGFSPGDRVTLHYTETAAGVRTWYDGSTVATKSIDVEVLDFAPIAEPAPSTVVNFELKIRKPGSVSVADLTAKNIMVEVYTPKRRDTVNQSGDTEITTPFFEIGERFEIVNGTHIQTQGTITEGDIFLKTRPYVGALDPNVLFNVIAEDFNFSDYYASNFYSFGRARTYFDTPEGVLMGAHIRYGEVYNVGSKNNGLTRFYLENIYGEGPGETTSAYGRIMKMTQRGNYMVVLQQSNSCHIPVYKTIWEDAEGQQQVAVSTKIFGPAQYNSAGDVGIGDSQTAFAKSANGTIYFIDPNNSMPMRDGYDGLKPIGGKMSKYFQKTLFAAAQAGKKVILYCNDFLNELVITLETTGEVLVRIPLDDFNVDVLETYNTTASAISLLAMPTKGTVTYNAVTGKAKYKSNPGLLGSDNFTFQFTINGVQVIKKACIVIGAGIKTVDQFQFVDVVNANIGAQYTSNGVLITGPNVPVPISITGGEYSINDGAFTSVAGYANPDDLIKVRATSSSTYLTNKDVVLTVGDRSDTYTITTKVSVPVNYTVAYGINPITQNGLIFTRNGVEVARFGNEGTGVLSNIFGAGDTIGIRNYSYGATTLPWEANSKANLNVKVGTVVRFNADITVQAIELQADSFVIAEGSAAITAIATGSSTAVGYVSKVLNVVSNTTAVRTTTTDTSGPKTVLRLENSIQASGTTQVFPYNLLNNANTQTLLIENLSSAATMSITVNGGATQVIAASGSLTVTGIVKDSINLTVSQTLP